MREEIKKMNDVILKDFIRNRLKLSSHEIGSFKLPVVENVLHTDPIIHKRFDMSGLGKNNSCQVYNTNILNLFADCGIYDYVNYLYLDAYKGTITLYYKFWGEKESGEDELGGYGTVDILKYILEKFCLKTLDKKERRF